MGPPRVLGVGGLMIGSVKAAETCLSQPQLFGVIFGSVAAAFLIAATLAILMYICFRKNAANVETDDKSAYANDACDVEDKAIDATTKKGINKDKMTMIDSFKLRKKGEDVGTQKAYSMEFINEVDGKVGVQLRAEDVNGLGFNIQGNMNEGIFVKEIISKGIAEQCGNILIGDKIKSLTISFENMVYQDAITLLSYASPYKVKLELERKLADNGSTSDSDEEKDARYHPLFRSNTLTHVHFNPLGSVSSSPKPQRCASANSTQKHALPPQKVEFREPDSTIGDTDSSVRDDDASRMESSDYGSDGTTSECRESTTSDGTQKTLSDRVEITDIIFDKVSSPTPPPHRKLEQCTELPPKVKKIVSRSPSPKHKPPPSPKMNRACSPIKQRVEDSTTQTAAPKPQRVETKPTQTDSTPTPPPVSSIPIRKENETQTPSSIPTRPPTPPPQQPQQQQKEETSKVPEITEARISRIPKRSDSIKTVVVERKLPALPKNAMTQRSHSADKNDNVWSRLYQEKKGQLRKTRDVSSPPAVHSGIPTPTSSPSKIVPPTSTHREDRYGTLTREKRDQLMANDAELDRQCEVLKKLGIL